VPRPRPLPGTGGYTLAHRLTRTADRLRQFNTRFGLRSRRVFLVWTQWTGSERGEGNETEVARRELLPTPRVTDGTAINRRPWAAGTMPEGSLRVDQISAGAYTEDNLRGLVVPPPTTEAPRGGAGTPVGGLGLADPRVPRPIDFYVEIVEDGRGDALPARRRYRVSGSPWRSESGLYWAVVLEASEDDANRAGDSRGDDLDLTGG
jgi:hypothetical protein